MTVLLWFALAVLVAVLAAKKDRSAIGFFILSALLSPIVGLIVLLVLGDGQKEGNGV